MAFALPLAASAMAAAAPAAAAAATKVSLMAVAKSVLMNVAISAAMSAFQPQVGSAGKTFEWTLDPNAPIPFAAGRVGVAGTVAHLETYGPDKMYYGFVSVLSGAGPIKSVTGFKGDDETVTFDGNGKAISSQWAGEMWLRTRLGTQPDTALTNPPGLKNNAQLPGWSAANKMSGKACYMLVLGENSKRTAYPTGEPKPLVTIEGLFGWDPRQDSTYPGGVGACRLNNPATWVWLDNPILWALKWSLGLWEGPIGKGAPGVDYQVGGIGAKVEGIDVPAFVAAANVADANGWKVAAYPTTDDDKAQVLDSFLQAGGAIYSERAGRISCIQRAAPRASVITISAADTAGPLEIDSAASRLDRINTIRPRFWSEAHRWQMTAIDDVSADAYRTQDGAIRPRGIDYPYVPLATQAAQLAALQIANTREGIAGTIPLKPHLRNITPGTAFTITEPGFLLDGLKCLALNVDYNPMTGVVSVDFVSETDAKYPFALGQSPIPPVPPALTAPDLTVTPPAVGEWAMTAATFTHDGVSVPALLFAGAVANSRAQSVIFEFRPVGAADWSGAGVEDPTVSRKEAAGGLLTPGVQYQGAVSYRVGGNISDRLILGPVTAGDLVSGDVSPITPANVAGVPTIAVATLIAPDGTQISRLTGTWTAAADGLSYVVELDNGIVVTQLPAATNGISQIVPTGPTYRYRVKALSRTGTMSAAWSAWSGNGAAAGDVTAPGPVTAPSILGGIGQISMRWTSPADDDLQRVLIFRNVSGISPDTTGEPPYGWSAGTEFIDYNAAIGTTYHYWAVTQDRSGNFDLAVNVYFGAASARRTRFDTDLVLIPPRLDPHPIFGGDYMMTDRLIYDDGLGIQALKPLEGGANKTETRTAAAFLGQGLLATRSTVDDDYISGSLAYRIAPHPTYGANFLDAGRTLYSNSFNLDQLRPGEFGSNVTENRTAAAIQGQGPGATAAANRVLNERLENGVRLVPRPDGGTFNVGSIQPGQLQVVLPFGGTTGSMISFDIEIYDYQVGQTVKYTVGGYLYNVLPPQWINYSAFYVGPRAFARPVKFGFYLGRAYVWIGSVGDQWAYSVVSITNVKIGFQNQGLAWESGWEVGLNNGDVSSAVSATVATPRAGDQVFGEGLLEAPGGAVALLSAHKTGLGNSAGIIGQGYFATADYADWSTRIIGPGKPSDNAGTSVTMIGAGGAAVVGNKVTATVPYPGWSEGAYSRERFRGSCYVGARTTHVDSNMVGLSDAADGAVNFADIDYAIYPNADGSIYCYESGSYVTALTVGYAGGDHLAVVYEGVHVNYYINGILVRSVATTAGRTFHAVVSLAANSGRGFSDIQVGPAFKEQRVDELWNSAGTAQYGQAQIVTAEGPAASVTGQTPWATLVRSVVAISKLDDAGRIIDGQALPLNGMSKSSTLAPAYPFSPGADPTTQINIAATVATFAGGTTLSMPSATISGLAESTLYAIFRDLVANSFVAISGSTTPYFTSAQRYLYIGAQATQEVGGGYEELPPPPPGSGGGYGDIPLYVPA